MNNNKTSRNVNFGNLAICNFDVNSVVFFFNLANVKFDKSNDHITSLAEVTNKLFCIDSKLTFIHTQYNIYVACIFINHARKCRQKEATFYTYTERNNI